MSDQAHVSLPSNENGGGMELLDVDPERYVVRVRGEPIVLEGIGLRVLLVLWKNQNYIVTRERMLEACWDHASEVTPKAVDVQVCRLRKCLGEAGALLESVRLFGYKLNMRRAAEVTVSVGNGQRRPNATRPSPSKRKR